MVKKHEVSTLVVLFSIFSLAFVFSGSAIVSIGGNFTVTPDSLYLNWTGFQINITSNQSGYNDTIYWMDNDTTTIRPQYFDENDYSAGDYEGFDSAKHSLCLANNIPFVVQNASGTYMNYTNPLNNTNSTYYNLTSYLDCPPGYYSGLFNVSENGTSDHANVTVYMNIPINSQNTFNSTSGIAYVKGNITADSSLIHKYYFNTSIADNVTGITINLTNHTQDIDMYLFDSSGTLLERSVENGTSTEEIYRTLPSTPDIWELWIWGNVTTVQNYVTYLYFTTLNTTNTSDDTKQITSIDFGTLDIDTTSSSEVNVTLKNTKVMNWTGVKERSELYTIQTWTDNNLTGDYYFIVPPFAQKIKAKMEWKGATHWTLSMNDSNTSFIGNSSGKYRTGNATNTVQEENVLYSGAISTSNDGVWKLTVGNTTTTGDDKYNITVHVWYDSSTLLNSTYPTAGFNFTDIGTANATKNITLKINTLTTNLSNGTYGGFIEYYKPSQWDYRIPVSFNVKTANMLVNNSFSSTTYTFKDVIGFERSGANVLQLALPINNTGGYDLSFVNTTSNFTLYKGAYFMNFTVGWPSNPLSAGSGGTIYVNVTINASYYDNSSGLYSGWIRFNTTNSTQPNASSYPYQSNDINIRVNLTSTLLLNLTATTPATVSQTENATNMTFNFTVKLQNGTNQYVSKNEILNHADFHDFDFTSINISYTAGTAATNYRTPATSGTWIVSCPAEASNPYSICMVNATIPSRIPGGRYNVRGGVTLNTSIIGGTGINISSDLTTSGTEVVINDAGLYIINKNHIWVNEAQYLDEGQYAIYVVYVKNYGPLVANNFMITLNNPSSCEVDIAPYVANTSCMGTAQSNSSGDTWTITTIPAYMGETNCTVAWKVTANTVTVDQSACYLNVGIDSSTQHGNYGNLTNIGVEVHDNSSTTSDPGTSSAPSTESGCTSDSDCAESQACVSGTCSAISCPSGYVKDHTCYSYENEFLISDYTETIEIVQGGSNSTKVTIKNNGAYTRVAKLNATSSVSGATTEVTPTSYNLATGNSGIFTVNLTSVEDIEVGYHKLTLKVYVSTNTSIYKTKEINLVVSPREETKVMINQTYDQLKLLFASVASLFNQIPPSTDGNYTIANRTYTRILNMLSEAKDKLNAGQYVDAYSILKETNTSISEFKNQISDMSESPIFEFGGTLGLVAIIVVIIVIGGFLVYLLMPPKKGYHPVFGYRPKKKFALPKKGGALGSIKDRFKNVKIGKKKQHTLGDYNGPMPFQKKKPSLLPRPPEPEKRSILEGYKSEEKFPYSFDKSGMKDKKKKFFGK